MALVLASGGGIQGPGLKTLGVHFCFVLSLPLFFYPDQHVPSVSVYMRFHSSQMFQCSANIGTA